MNLDEVLQQYLKKKPSSADSAWQIWEHKTLNMHRGVLCWNPNPGLNCTQMVEQVRGQIDSSFHISWWRGFGFGVIIDSPLIPGDIIQIENAIDTRNSEKGTWQWTIFSCKSLKTVFGMHTWAEGYLSTSFRQILSNCESEGYATGIFKKEKDRLMQFLTETASLKGIEFQEFKP